MSPTPRVQHGVRTEQTRREFLAIAAGAAALAAAGGCTGVDRKRVVMYSSADDPLVREVAAAFEKSTGLSVAAVGDTEATKTTGLVARLIAEKSSPRADVWWSSEALGSVKLAGEGVLEPYRSPQVLGPGGQSLWPEGMHAADFSWTGFACRARVIAYSTKKFPSPPESLTLERLLLSPAGLRVGLARPQFGTTRSHVAALLASHGPERVAGLLRSGRAGGLRLYDSNSSVVRAIAQGEIDVAPTDSDDAYVARREGWPVGFVFEPRENGKDPASMPCSGPLLLPNTVALVRGGPNPAGGKRLVDFLLSAEGERLLARSESGNTPVRSELASEFPDLEVPTPWIVDWQRVGAAVPEAMRIVEETLGG